MSRPTAVALGGRVLAEEREMTLRKVQGYDEKLPCRHPDHNPPIMILLDPGVYENVCPACGAKTTFRVPPRPTCEG